MDRPANQKIMMGYAAVLLRCWHDSLQLLLNNDVDNWAQLLLHNTLGIEDACNIQHIIRVCICGKCCAFIYNYLKGEKLSQSQEL